MLIRIYLVIVVLCAVVNFIQCERGYCKNCRFIPYKRIKRGKYYSSPPKRFYSRPPVRFPYIEGAFSYTPPPNHMVEDEQPYPGPPSPYKVSKRPSNDGLGDDELNNLMKHLTKQDLDKILEFASEKQKNERPYPNSLDNFSNEYRYPKKREEINAYKANDDDFAAFEKFEKVSEETKKENARPVENKYKYSFNGPYLNQEPYEVNPNEHYTTEQPSQYVVELDNTYKEMRDANRQHKPQTNADNKEQEYANIMKDLEQINNYASEVSNNNGEYLTQSSNLKPEDYDTMYTNNVPNVVKAETSAYKVEGFGDLPLMNYNSKLGTVSSYHVPHYTITTPPRYQVPASSSSSSYGPPSSSLSIPPLEPAPSISAAREQSDAHLKAVKIWSHRSKGTAYTLHNDGTLTLEKPLRPKGNYGYY